MKMFLACLILTSAVPAVARDRSGASVGVPAAAAGHTAGLASKQSTNPDGTFGFSALPGGVYSVTFDKTDSMAMRMTEVLSSRDFGLGMGLTVTARGASSISIRELRAPKTVPRQAWNWYRKAIAQDKRGNYQEAQLLVHHAIALSPDFFQAHAAMAVYYLRSAQLVPAEREVKEALRSDAFYLPASELMAVLYFLRGDLARAEEAFHAISKADPSRPVSHYFMGRIALAEGRGQEAQEQLRTAERLQRHPPKPPGESVESEE